MINSRHVDSENHASIYTRECRSEEIMHAYSEIIWYCTNAKEKWLITFYE